MQLNCLYQPLLDTQIAAYTSPAIDVRGFQQLAVYLSGTGTVSGGTLAITEAPTPNYAGTWSTISVTLTPSGVTGTKTQALALPSAAYAFIRAELTGAITGGGSINLVLIGI